MAICGMVKYLQYIYHLQNNCFEYVQYDIHSLIYAIGIAIPFAVVSHINNDCYKTHDMLFKIFKCIQYKLDWHMQSWERYVLIRKVASDHNAD